MWLTGAPALPAGIAATLRTGRPTVKAAARLRPDRQDDLPAHVSRLAELMCTLHLREGKRLDLHPHVSSRHQLADPTQLLRARARHVQLRSRPARVRGLLRRSAGDGHEDASLAQGGQQRLGGVPTDSVERDVDAADRFTHVLLCVVDVLVRAETEHEVAIAGGP